VTQSTWLRVSFAHESVKNRIGDSQLTIEFLDRYKPLEIERLLEIERKAQAHYAGLRVLPLQAMECEIFKATQVRACREWPSNIPLRKNLDIFLEGFLS
jgi:hypothetical protein